MKGFRVEIKGGFLMSNIRRLREDFGLTQEELASNLGVSPQTVWGWENGKFSPKGKRLRDVARFFGVAEADIQSPQIKRRISVLGYVPAGIPLEAIEDVVGYEDIPAEWQGEYFGLKVRGDSMSPKYLEGDTIIVKVQPTCESGQDCIVRVNGFDATLKSVYINEDSFELVPYNKEYESMVFSKVEIIGVVVELRRSIL